MKIFNLWNTKKQVLHQDGKSPYYHEREVWWCSLGVNVGFEENGTGRNFDRPVVILKSLGRNICLIIPLTTSTKKHPMRLDVGEVSGKEAHALLSQIRVVDTKRLLRKTGYLNKEKFELLRKNIKDFL